MKSLLASVGKWLGSMVLVLAIGSAVARSAHADEVAGDAASRAAAVTKLSDEGFGLYQARDYRHAVERFLQAYALDQDPNLLFNIARCYEAMGDVDSAIEKYETFLAKPDADAQGKRRANDAIRALRHAKSSAAEVRAKPPALVAVPAAEPPVVAAATNPAAPPGANQKPREEKGSFLSPPVITLGVGVLVAAVGAVSYSMGAGDHDKVTGSANYGMAGQVDPLTQAEAQKLVDSGNTKKLIGGIALGVGGALMATSAVLFITGHHNAEPRGTGAVAFGAAPLKDGGAMFVQGRF